MSSTETLPQPFSRHHFFNTNFSMATILQLNTSSMWHLFACCVFLTTKFSETHSHKYPTTGSALYQQLATAGCCWCIQSTQFGSPRGCQDNRFVLSFCYWSFSLTSAWEWVFWIRMGKYTWLSQQLFIELQYVLNYWWMGTCSTHGKENAIS